MRRVMVDLETLGNGADAVILSIGAVVFGDGKILDRFHVFVDPQSCIDWGLSVDGSTILWWFKQSGEARSQFQEGKGTYLEDALQLFTNWVTDYSKISSQHIEILGNGASFDNPILETAYRKVDKFKPWEFWNNSCYRTMKKLVPEVKIKRKGAYHNALDDAESQALHLMEIEKVLGRTTCQKRDLIAVRPQI